MLYISQMKGWISETVAHFKEVMPEIDVPYPEIFVVSTNKTLETRASVVERLRSPQKNVLYISKMETIHGENGDAILIYQKYMTDFPTQNIDLKSLFQHYLWHELGRFFAINMECPGENLFRYIDQKLHFEDFTSQLGYWFWSEFIAEVIACRCSSAVDCSTETFSINDKKTELSVLINDTFCKYEDFIDQFALGKYYAKLLTDKTIHEFVKDENKEGLTTLNIPNYYLPLLNELQIMLETQLSHDQYWSTNIDFVTDIGHVIEELRNIKLMHSSQETFGKLLHGLSGHYELSITNYN